MATISVNERNQIMDAVLTISLEDYNIAGRALRLLQTSLPAFTWDTILRSRAGNWQPYINSGLSITWWCDEVLRLAAIGG